MANIDGPKYLGPTVVDLTGPSPVVLREGPITTAQLLDLS